MPLGGIPIQRLRLGAVCCLLLLAGCAALAPAADAGEWLFPGGYFTEGSQPQVAMNAASETVAAFVGYGPEIRASLRATGGQFSGGVFGEAVSTEDRSVHSPDVAIDSAGDILVVWQQGEGPSESRIFASFRPVGGPFGTPIRLSSTGASAPVVAMDAGGDATVAWLLDDGTDEVVQATTGHGESFSAPVALSGDGGDAASPAVSMDTAGDAVASWTRTDAGVTELEDALRRAGGGFSLPDGQGDGSIIGATEPSSTKQPDEPPVQQIVMGGHSEAVVTWRGQGGEVRVARLPASAPAFGAPVTLGSSTAIPSAAMNEAGEAVVGWPVALGVEVATAAAGEPFGAPVRVPALNGRTPEVAKLTLAPDGAVAVAWVRGPEDGKGESGEVGQEGVVRPPGGTFSAPRGLFGGNGFLAPGSLELASDAQGDVFGMWQENTIIGDNVRAITYDNGPILGSVSAPSTGQTGQSLSFSIPPPVSLWKPVQTVTWNFGDGTTGSGLATAHVYTQPGVYTVTVTASDGQAMPFQPIPEYVGSSATHTVTITPQPNSPHPPLAALSVPILGNASESHRAWREGRQLAQISRDDRQPPVGTVFSFSLNEPASVSFDFTQQAAGRKVRGACVTRTTRNAHSPLCRRTVTRGVLSFHAHTGMNRVSFQGHIAPRKLLVPGRYSLAIAATDAAGGRSSPTMLTFTILK